MGVITFRENVPASTPAKAPITIQLNPMSRAIQEFVVWAGSSTGDLSKYGYRLFGGRHNILIPDSGSWGIESFAAPEEFGWAPLPPTPKAINMNDQLIEGPPYLLTLQFYNIDAAALTVAGWLIVRDPFAFMPANQEEEFMTKLGPKAEFVQETTQGLPMERGPAKEKK